MLALRLPPEIEKRLAALAKKTGRTKTFYAREAILRHLEDLEDAHLARRRLARAAPLRACADPRPQRAVALSRGRLPHRRRHRGRPLRGTRRHHRPSAGSLRLKPHRNLVQAPPRQAVYHVGAER